MNTTVQEKWEKQLDDDKNFIINNMGEEIYQFLKEIKFDKVERYSYCGQFDTEPNWDVRVVFRHGDFQYHTMRPNLFAQTSHLSCSEGSPLYEKFYRKWSKKSYSSVDVFNDPMDQVKVKMEKYILQFFNPETMIVEKENREKEANLTHTFQKIKNAQVKDVTVEGADSQKPDEFVVVLDNGKKMLCKMLRLEEN